MKNNILKYNFDTVSTNEIVITESNIAKLDSILAKMNVDINSLKKTHLHRRIKVRMLRNGLQSFDDYYNLLQTSDEEKNELKIVFSINVTRFFRNMDTWDFLKQEIFPLVIRKTTKTIQIWSAGCASGAEPYTLAMIFNNFNVRPEKINILATDYNPDLLNFARKGFYTKEYLEEIRKDYFVNYFTRAEKEQSKVDPSLIKYIDFRKHNLVKDKFPMKDHFDIIVCRNVLIYFTRELQPVLFENFYRALKINGYLVLGRTESLPYEFRKRFKTINSKHRVFQKVFL